MFFQTNSVMHCLLKLCLKAKTKERGNYRQYVRIMAQNHIYCTWLYMILARIDHICTIVSTYLLNQRILLEEYSYFNKVQFSHQ